MVVRRTDLADGQHVERAAEPRRHGGGDGHTAAGQAEHDHVAGPRDAELFDHRVGQHRAGVGPIPEPRPPTHVVNGNTTRSNVANDNIRPSSGDEPMPALPWTTITTPDPARTYVGFATKLPLTAPPAHPRVPARHPARAPPARPTPPVSSATRCWPNWAAKTFWTVSVWEDEPALRAFAAAEPHRSITRRSPGRMGASRFETFAVAGTDVPLDWADVRRRLASA